MSTLIYFLFIKLKFDNNKIMNQILYNKNKTKKKKYFFKIQLLISIILVIFFIIYILNDYKKNEKLENISAVIDTNINISSIYKEKYQSNRLLNKNIYLGKIVIGKINLEYTVFNNYNIELLKIAPCKFYGGILGEKGNICIAGHNYNDSKFFGRIDELEIKDKIKMVDLEEKEYEYIVYDKFETDEEDLSILKSNKNYELTLLTCNNSNKKRIIVKAFMKD